MVCSTVGGAVGAVTSTVGVGSTVGAGVGGASGTNVAVSGGAAGSTGGVTSGVTTGVTAGASGGSVGKSALAIGFLTSLVPPTLEAKELITCSAVPPERATPTAFAIVGLTSAEIRELAPAAATAFVKMSEASPPLAAV